MHNLRWYPAREERQQFLRSKRSLGLGPRQDNGLHPGRQHFCHAPPLFVLQAAKHEPRPDRRSQFEVNGLEERFDR